MFFSNRQAGIIKNELRSPRPGACIPRSGMVFCLVPGCGKKEKNARYPHPISIKRAFVLQFTGFGMEPVLKSFSESPAAYLPAGAFSLAGAFFTAGSLAGAVLAAVFLAGAFFTAGFLAEAFLAAAFLAGAFFTAAFLQGQQGLPLLLQQQPGAFLHSVLG